VIPSESYSALSGEDERLRSIAELQQKIQVLNYEAALRQSEDRFRLLVENIADYAIFMLDAGGLISSWNAGAERIKGYRASEIIGKHFSIFYSAEDLKAGKPELGLKRASAEGRFETEGWRLRKDGSRFWAYVTITALRDESGNLRGFAKVTRDLTERKRMEDSLRELSGRLISLQDQERRRLARELHDSTAQTLSALSLNLALVGRCADLARHPQASKALSESLALADQASHEIRTLSYLLHPPWLDEMGLAAALRWYIGGFAQRTTIRVDFQVVHEPGRLRRDVETSLFRIVQECLTNVYRHSGSPKAGVRLDETSAGISLAVWDQGKGIPEPMLQRDHPSPAMFGVGLRGMAERVRQLGGQLTVRQAQPGTIIEVLVPSDQVAGA
jgi:PAS domain S-box-containing protein